MNVVYLIIPIINLTLPWLLLLMVYFFPSILTIISLTAYVLYLTFVLFDPADHNGHGRFWPAFCNLKMWHVMMQYHDTELIRDSPKPFDSDRTYIFGLHPHGHLAFLRTIFVFSRHLRWDKLFPKIKTRTLAASAALKFPGIRECFMWTDAIDASRKSAQKAISKGFSLFIYVGGEKEQLMTDRFTEKVYILDRKGFVKLALQEGCDLVPCYQFGQNDLYESVDWFTKERRWLQEKFKIAIPLYHGRFLMWPYPAKALMVVGAAISVKKTVDPSEEEIDELHGKYVEGLKQLFDKYKARAGVGDRKLEVL
jgi:hypothetical protein